MKLSISNIGWSSEKDAIVYKMMGKYGYSGLEIAPTRIFSETPYERLKEAEIWSRRLLKDYGFVIPSMQSIWYGRTERLFGTDAEKEFLINYTKKAIDFAAAVQCRNLVFGCPKNRNLPEDRNPREAIRFFRELGDYAAKRNIVIGLEANPSIYGTNYINDTKSALELIRETGSEGFLLNLDIGTMLQNREDISELEGSVRYISHVHISEPGLKPLMQREIHKELCHMLKKEGYAEYISIEMGNIDDLDVLENSLRYIGEIFIHE